jgi:hypothetical protein
MPPMEYRVELPLKTDYPASKLSYGMFLKEALLRRLGKVPLKYVVLLVPLQACRRPPDLYLTLP